MTGEDRFDVYDRPLLEAWCAERGWAAWVVDVLGLSIVIDDSGEHRVRFPYRLDGHGVPFWQDHALDPEVRPRWLSPSGRRPVLHEAARLQLAYERGAVFVVQSPTDLAALVDVYANPAVVAVPGIGAWRSSWARVFAGLRVYAVASNDSSGEVLRARLSHDLTRVAAEVRQVYVPAPQVDLAEWRAGLDPGAFDAQLMAAADAGGQCLERRGVA